MYGEEPSLLEILIQQSLLFIGLVSVLPLMAGSLCAGIFVILQAVTQIQEQTIIHIVRVLVCSFVLYAAAPWISEFFSQIMVITLQNIRSLGGPV